MEIKDIIRHSEWWRRAQQTPDRHYEPTSGVSLAGHLEAVLRNLRSLLFPAAEQDYASALSQVLIGYGFDLTEVWEVLAPVALLHDIGKLDEDKELDIRHPLTGKTVEKRHPIAGVCAALAVLPEGLMFRARILALIEDHDTPYSWYTQYLRTGQVPGRKAWARLDRGIDPQEDGTGIILLSLFKIADTDGHEDMADVPWFIEQANTHYLREKGKWLPVPDVEDVKSLSESGPGSPDAVGGRTA
jgi:hypothetical protein